MQAISCTPSLVYAVQFPGTHYAGKGYEIVRKGRPALSLTLGGTLCPTWSLAEPDFVISIPSLQFHYAQLHVRLKQVRLPFFAKLHRRFLIHMGAMGSAKENKISTEKEKGFRRFWHQITKPHPSDHKKTAPTKGLLPPSAEKARPSTPAPKNSEPQQPGAKPGTEGVKEEARIGNGSNGQDHIEEQGRNKTEQSENIDRPGAPGGEKDAHQHGPKRDLWSEAWKSSKLADVKKRLESPWKDPGGNAPDKPSKASNGAKNAKGPKSPQGAAPSPAHEDPSGHANSKEVELPQQLVVEVVRMTKTRMATYQERWGSESESTIASTARDALLSALIVKDLVDAGLAFDPTGYGACGWAVISFGLKVRATI